MAFPVIVEIEDGPIWERNTPNRLSEAVIAILVLIYVIAEMKDIVHRVLAYRIAVGIEKAKRKVAARVYRKANVCNCVVCCWSGLGTTKDRGLVRVANAELVVVLGKRAQVIGLDLTSCQQSASWYSEESFELTLTV